MTLADYMDDVSLSRFYSELEGAIGRWLAWGGKDDQPGWSELAELAVRLASGTGAQLNLLAYMLGLPSDAELVNDAWKALAVEERTAVQHWMESVRVPQVEQGIAAWREADPAGAELFDAAQSAFADAWRAAHPDGHTLGPDVDHGDPDAVQSGLPLLEAPGLLDIWNALPSAVKVAVGVGAALVVASVLDRFNRS